MSDSGKNQNDDLMKNKQIETESNEHWKSNIYIITYKEDVSVQVEEGTTEKSNTDDQIKTLVNLDKCIVPKVTHNTISPVKVKNDMIEKEYITRQTTSKQTSLSENKVSNISIVKNYTELQQSKCENGDSIKYDMFMDSDPIKIVSAIEIPKITEKCSDSNSQVVKLKYHDSKNHAFIKNYPKEQRKSESQNMETLVNKNYCSLNIIDNVKHLAEIEELTSKSSNSVAFDVLSSNSPVKLVETEAISIDYSSDSHRGIEITSSANKDELSVIYYLGNSTKAEVYKTDKSSVHIQDTQKKEIITNTDVYKIHNNKNQEGIQKLCDNLSSDIQEVLVDGSVIQIIEIQENSSANSCLDNELIQTQTCEFNSEFPFIDITNRFINTNLNGRNNIHQNNVNPVHTSNLTTVQNYPSQRINLDPCQVLVDKHTTKNLEIQSNNKNVCCNDDQLIRTETHLDQHKIIYNVNQHKSNKIVGNSTNTYHGVIKGVFENCNNLTDNLVCESNIFDTEKKEFDYEVIEPQLHLYENEERISSDIYILKNVEKIAEKYKNIEADHGTRDNNAALKQSFLNVPVVDFESDKSVKAEPRRPSIIKPRAGSSDYSKKLHVHFEDQEPTDEKEKFLRIIFTILGIMLSITITTIVTSMTINHVNAFWRTREGNHLFVLSTMIALSSSTAAFCPNIMRALPSSCVIIMITVASYSIFLGYLTVRWDTKFFLYGYTCNAALIFLCLVLTSKSFDFTGWALYWTALATVMTVLTICMVVEFMLFNPDITMYKAFVLYAGVMLNCAFLIIILQIILGGTIIESRKDDYMLSAFMLYTSTPGFFIQLFRLLCLIDLD